MIQIKNNIFGSGWRYVEMNGKKIVNKSETYPASEKPLDLSKYGSLSFDEVLNRHGRPEAGVESLSAQISKDFEALFTDAEGMLDLSFIENLRDDVEIVLNSRDTDDKSIKDYMSAQELTTYFLALKDATAKKVAQIVKDNAKHPQYREILDVAKQSATIIKVGVLATIEEMIEAKVQEASERFHKLENQVNDAVRQKGENAKKIAELEAQLLEAKQNLAHLTVLYKKYKTEELEGASKEAKKADTRIFFTEEGSVDPQGRYHYGSNAYEVKLGRVNDEIARQDATKADLDSAIKKKKNQADAASVMVDSVSQPGGPQ